MPIKIHHGPPGAYKTAGAMADDFLREAKAGRVIVTNVRGVSADRTREEFPELPESFDVIYVDDKSSEGRAKWATWFHWVPHGAFLMVDEVQDIWPKSWREANIRALDYPGGVDQATKDDRPKDWEQALDKHRHYNWDMTLTTPSYAKVREDIRGIADMAYKHKNLALLGGLFKGRYIEGAHAADDMGKAASDFINVQKKKVPAYVFRLYDSTQTGVVSDTKSGFNLFTNPRVMVLLAILGVVGSIVATRPVPLVGAGSAQAVGQAAPAAGKTGPAAGGASGAVAGGSSSSRTSFIGAGVRPFEGDGVYIIASVLVGHTWRYAVSFANTEFTSGQLLDMGYTISPRGGCGVVLKKDEFERFITCGSDGKRAPAERSLAAAKATGPAPSPAVAIAPPPI